MVALIVNCEETRRFRRDYFWGNAHHWQPDSFQVKNGKAMKRTSTVLLPLSEQGLVRAWR